MFFRALGMFMLRKQKLATFFMVRLFEGSAKLIERRFLIKRGAYFDKEK